MFISASVGGWIVDCKHVKVAQLQSSKVVSGNPPACNCQKGVTDMRSGGNDTKNTMKIQQQNTMKIQQ